MEVRKTKCKEEKTIPAMSTDQGFITNDVDKANHVRNASNLFFLPPQAIAPTAESALCRLAAMQDINVTYDGVLEVFEELKPHSAPGPEAIPWFVLKKVRTLWWLNFLS